MPKGAPSAQTLPPTPGPPRLVASQPAKTAALPLSKHDELRLLVNSRHPSITVETPEEERLEQLLLDVASELNVPLYTWSVTTGVARMPRRADVQH